MSPSFHRILVLALVLVAWAIFTPAAKLLADQADDQFAAAASRYSRGQWRLAAEEFQAFLRKYPHYSRANECVFFLGEAQIQLGQFADARRQFSSYLSLDPKGKYARSATFRLGEAAYLAGDFQKAKPDLARFLAKYPNDPLVAVVLPYLGDIAAAAGDSRAAADYYRDALRRFPQGRLQDDCRIGLAGALEMRKQTDEAEQLYRAVAAKPGSPLADTAQYRLGLLQSNAGKYDRAAASFAAFDSDWPKSPWRLNARLGRGMALLKLNRPVEAIQQFDAVLAASPVGEELLQRAIRGKLQAAIQMKDYAALERQAAEFQKRYPASAIGGEAQRMLARGLVERKEYARAAALLEASIGDLQANRFGPGSQDLQSCYLLALCYENLGRYDDALAALSPVFAHAGGALKTDAELVGGSLLMATKKYAEAVAPLEAFLAGKPTGDAEARAIGELAICSAHAGQIDKAKRLYAELLRKYPRHPLIEPITESLVDAAYDAGDAAWMAELSSRLAAGSSEYAIKGELELGWSQFLAGKPAEAAATFDAVLKKHPPAPIVAEAALARGQILEKLGQNEPALAMYNLVIEQCAKSRQYGDALLAAARLYNQLNQPQARPRSTNGSTASIRRPSSSTPRSTIAPGRFWTWARSPKPTGSSSN